jgi:hypothetical protein
MKMGKDILQFYNYKLLVGKRMKQCSALGKRIVIEPHAALHSSTACAFPIVSIAMSANVRQ